MSSMKVKSGFRRGGASLLTTAVLAVLLIGVIGGLTVLSINELRQAANKEQSARALSAAESHIDTLAQTIDTEVGSHERTACNATPDAPGTEKGPIDFADNSYITCATVTAADSDETVGVIQRDQSYRLDLSKAYLDDPSNPVQVAKMSIEWAGNEDFPASISGFSPFTVFDSLFIGNKTSPAALELTYVGWSSAGGTIAPLTGTNDYGLGFKKVVLRPGQGAVPNTIPATICNTYGTSVDGYYCRTGVSAAVTSFDLSTGVGFSSTQNLVFKLTARYNRTKFRLKFFNSADQILKVPQPYATIDVTARSNNLYRRVIAQKPLTLETPIDYLDNAIFSGKNICKDMKVDQGHDVAKYTDGTPAGDGKNTQACENPSP